MSRRAPAWRLLFIVVLGAIFFEAHVDPPAAGSST